MAVLGEDQPIPSLFEDEPQHTALSNKHVRDLLRPLCSRDMNDDDLDIVAVRCTLAGIEVGTRAFYMASAIVESSKCFIINVIDRLDRGDTLSEAAVILKEQFRSRTSKEVDLETQTPPDNHLEHEEPQQTDIPTPPPDNATVAIVPSPQETALAPFEKAKVSIRETLSTPLSDAALVRLIERGEAVGLVPATVDFEIALDIVRRQKVQYQSIVRWRREYPELSVAELGKTVELAREYDAKSSVSLIVKYRSQLESLMLSNSLEAILEEFMGIFRSYNFPLHAIFHGIEEYFDGSVLEAFGLLQDHPRAFVYLLQGKVDIIDVAFLSAGIIGGKDDCFPSRFEYLNGEQFPESMEFKRRFKRDIDQS